LRYGGGKHFFSDIIVGYAVGAAIGILVPQLHKVNNKP
jgi:membrane-associated phospholipid phosphatase